MICLGELLLMPSMRFHHEPVLVDEVLSFLEPAPGKVFLDGTLGGGGHSQAILDRGASVIGLDQDEEALAFATERLGKYGPRFFAEHANFARAGEVLERIGTAQVDGVLLDLGVSSWQLDAPHRGFSFMHDGPLDMRMDTESPVTAADLVNHAPVEQLEQLFREFGEEPAARRITARILKERAVRPLETTAQLANLVAEVAPRRGRTHPATRVFQALRIAVNRELEVLREALVKFGPLLKPGARFAIITFHSLEDRLVKNFFRDHSKAWIDRPEWPEPRPNPDHIYRLLTTKPVTPGAEEETRNPRSRSAKLRVVEKL
jgi:16S rRNA (cytosine1402-N4)-methyltransferase